MTTRSLRKTIVSAAILIFALGGARIVSAQMAVAGGQQATPQSTGVDSLQTQLHMLTDVQTHEADKKELEAYKAFYTQTAEIDKRIQLGQSFLQKYPKSVLVEPVEAGLVNAYYQKQDWQNFYAYADKALALKPDDVDVLTTVGWVIPHEYQANDPDSDSQFDKAETYEKHALDTMSKMQKPSNLSATQFDALKVEKTNEAHSALGLVYFRRENFEASANELQEALKSNPSPDPTDLFVFGVDLQNLKRYSEAADAFNRCSQSPGGLQDRCKENADNAKKLASLK